MQRRAGDNNNINSRKAAPLHPHENGKKMEVQRIKPQTAEETTMADRRRSGKERKMALLQDVDNLKKKLRHEENVHRALQRAFTRPLGALPRLPAYLPQYTLELLAEVAVLEEEVVRLEERIVNLENANNELSIGSFKRGHSRSSSRGDANFGSIQTRPCRSPSPSLSRVASIRKILFSNSVPDCSRHFTHESPPINKRSANSCKESKPNAGKKSSEMKNTVKRRTNSPKMQCRIVEQAQETSSGSSDGRVVDADSEANTLSEDILNCLINIFVRLSSSKGKKMDSEYFSSLAARASFDENNKESNFRDPNCDLSESKKIDIGTEKYLYVIEARSIDLKRKTNAYFLIQRLKILLDKLSSVRLDGLSHHQKLAFWINIYNASIMKAYLDHGIPESPEEIVDQMQTATINAGGHKLNPVMIEHLILRLPYHLKYTCLKSAKNNERTICKTLGLDWPEPLVTFALSCGSWSSPAVKVYTASRIEIELEAAKRDYLQGAIFVSSSDKIVIPKLLDWYLLDFAKDLDSLLDWICLQLPDDIRDEAVKCVERRLKEPLSNLVQVMPHNFSFRYLIHR
ncbi:Protein of unknown function- DUF547 [Striga hermonthica]|uniref:DUF547 domain-containing protein n=1 Tax=Striga hermonthica TaxID=68872 RepID=A0A9N7RT88_STRHE|nr:Protein of unknown function- DUF547 [Striga hermonthica]